MITIKGKPISQKTIFIVVLSALGVLLVGLCIGLVVALTPKDKAVVAPSSSQTEESSSALSSAAESSTVENAASGESAVSQAAVKEITVKVVHGDGSEKEFPISTEAETLGDALMAEGLVEGEESSYGLFITTVDGETADDSNQEWWCLTKGGEMWNYGADSTELSDGDTYELTLTVGY